MNSVQINKLEWDRNTHGSAAVAETPIGVFRVVFVGKQVNAVWGETVQSLHYEPCDSIEEAKTKCQDEFERRVKACVSSSVIRWFPPNDFEALCPAAD